MYGYSSLDDIMRKFIAEEVEKHEKDRKERMEKIEKDHQVLQYTITGLVTKIRQLEQKIKSSEEEEE